MAVTLASVRQLSGIQEVTGDLSAHTLVVTFDQNQVEQEQIIQAVKEVGFEVEGTFAP